MLIQIASVLTEHDCAAIRDVLSDTALWRDGRETAGGAAQAVKANRQADMSAPVIKGAAAKIEKALRANAVFRAAAQPAAFGRIIFNRFQPGMEYGDHVDAAYIDGLRTDLSFTVFLSDPRSYEGGELIIDHAGHEDTVKIQAGSMILYPSTAVHRVAQVTKGERIACAGWIKSRIKSAEDRALVFDLEMILADLHNLGASGAIHTRLANVRNNLLRKFGD